MGQRRDELLERARALPELLFRADRQPVALKAQGARIYDVDNLGYIDYTGAGGAAIVGYANQFILDAVRKVLGSGLPDGLHVPQEVELAESLQQFLPWASSLWLSRNQEEALRRALQWVRLRTGRDGILVLDGGARLPVDVVGTASERERAPVREVPGWDLARIEATLSAGASKIGALVVDPLMTRFGVIPPPEGVVRQIADLCRRLGVLVVLDERVSGFRVDRGGAAAWLDVVPDVAVYGGALGGGFPIGVVAFREPAEAVMDADNGPVPAPHPVSLAAADAVLSILKNNTIYGRLEERAEQLSSGVTALAARFQRPMVVNRVGSVFALFISRGPVSNATAVEAGDRVAYRRLADALQEEGVLLPHEPGGTAFVSSAHGAKDIEETLAVFERVLMRLHKEDLP
jgi:glutamate-1-semialdehyde 2,1-aminomutase